MDSPLDVEKWEDKDGTNWCRTLVRGALEYIWRIETVETRFHNCVRIVVLTSHFSPFLQESLVEMLQKDDT